MKKVTKINKRTSDLSILYIESDLSLQNEISLHLKKIFSNVFQAYNGIEGLEEFIKNKPDIILTDLSLLNKNSFKMIVEIQEISADVSVIVLSNRNSDFELLETIDLGIVSLLKKPLHLTNLNRALQKIILLKPNKIEPAKIKKPIVNAIKPEPIKTKPLVTIKPIKRELLREEPVKLIPVIREPIKIDAPIIKEIKPEPVKIEIPVVKPTIPTPTKVVEPVIKRISGLEILQTALQNKTNVTCVNNYKGLIITNNAEILQVNGNNFTLKVSKTQFVSVKYERQMTVTINQHAIQSKLIEVDKKNTTVTLANPELIKFLLRDSSNKRISVDKSFKTSIGFQNTHAELTPIDISYSYIALETTESLNLKVNDSVDLTLGFEINGPSSLVSEKKFTKTFATGIIQRIQNINNKQKIIIKHKIQKSGQNVFRKYLQEREIEIINEFKMKMKL